MTYNYLSAECSENIKLKRQVFALWNPESGKIWLNGIWNPTKYWNPESKFY